MNQPKNCQQFLNFSLNLFIARGAVFVLGIFEYFVFTFFGTRVLTRGMRCYNFLEIRIKLKDTDL